MKNTEIVKHSGQKKTCVSKCVCENLSAPILTFMAESEPSLFTRFYAGYPNVIVVDEADKVGVPGADLGVHACAWTLAFYLYGVHGRRLHKHTERSEDKFVMKRETDS